MKKCFWILGMMVIFSTFWSCNNDDDYTNFRYVARGIDSISMPTTANLGQRVEIRTHTTGLSDCMAFQTHGYDPIGNERTVVTWFVEYDVECGEEVVASPYFYFTPVEPGTYNFRFWAGQDEDTQEDIFITRDIVINNTITE